MNIAANYNSEIVAVACDTSRKTDYKTVQGEVFIYNLKQAKCKNEFPVRFDAGGRRLALSRANEQCFVGCYNVYGLAAYSVSNGSELWRRKDLKAVQHITAFTFDDVVFCGREGASHLLCAKTGETLEKLSGVKHVYSSPFSTHTLVSAPKLEVHSPLGTVIGKIKRTTFADLDCCFSDSDVLVTESTGGVRCFDLSSLELMWTHTPKAGSHFLSLAFSKRLGCFVGIRWNYESRTANPKRIVLFERNTGTVIKELPFKSVAQHEFCLGGDAVLTSSFSLIRTETGEIIREFKHSAGK